MNALHNRMAKEIKTLRKKPPEGVCVWQADGACVTRLCAQVQGPAGTVYEAGVFRLNVDVPERYAMDCRGRLVRSGCMQLIAMHPARTVLCQPVRGPVEATHGWCVRLHHDP
jgi:hypothetical protein